MSLVLLCCASRRLCVGPITRPVESYRLWWDDLAFALWKNKQTNKQTACASYLPIESIYKLIYCSCLELKLVRIKLIARCANIRPDCEIFLH